MSIFKETLPRYIIDQLTIREAVVSHGNNVDPNTKGAARTSTNYSQKSNKRLLLKGSGKKISIPPGAFYTNTTSKQCVLRMSSGVDIKKGTFPTWGSEPTGLELSMRWVLEGGVPKENYVKRKVKDSEGNVKQDESGNDVYEEVFIKRHNTPRGGFAKGKGSAYGDRKIRSSAKDGFGIVPMPGIVDATVRTKTAYGSLRDAKINFVCHNRDQLEVLEMLYMRPGYPVLLEWGWSPYIDNNGKLENRFPILSEWWDKKSTLDFINEVIILRKARSGGNYDAMAGIVKNFEINARPDGGYNCSTELISLGEVLEGLKGSTSEEDTTNYRQNQDPSRTAPINNFLKHLHFLKQFTHSSALFGGVNNLSEGFLDILYMYTEDFFGGMVGDEADFDQKAWIQSMFQNVMEGMGMDISQGTVNDIFSAAAQSGQSVSPMNTSIYSNQQSNANQLNQSILEGNLNDAQKEFLESTGGGVAGGEPQNTVNVENDQEFNERLARKLIPFVIPTMEQLSPADDDTKIQRAHFPGVRWDFIVEIFNTYVVPHIKPKSRNNLKLILNENLEPVNIKKEEPEPLSSFTYYDGNTNKYLNYTKVQFPSGFKVIWKDSEGAEELDSGKLLGGSLNKDICLLPHQFIRPFVKGLEEGTAGNIGVSESVQTNRSIGKVFINIDYLINVYIKMFYDKEGLVKDEFSFLDFFKKVWEQDINEACGGQHNFVINTDPIRNTRYRVIDYDIQTLDVKAPAFKDQKPQFTGIRAEDVFEFKIQSNESIVRDFNFNTSIPADMASMISIAAQCPDNVSSLDEISFAAFNKNIKSRFTIVEESTVENEEEKFNNEVRQLNEALNDLISYNSKMLIKGGEGNETLREHISIHEAKDILSNLETLIYKVTSRDWQTTLDRQNNEIPPTYARTKNPIPAKSAVIPLRFNCRLDGIAGMVIGNVFKVTKSRLPKGYQADDVAFIITSENQTMTVGQDWTTDITGQLMLLDLEKERVELDGMEVEPIELELGEIFYSTEELFELWKQAQGLEADYWTMVAIIVCEAGAGTRGLEQSMADIATSILNRHESPSYSTSKSKYGATIVGQSIKSIIIAPPLDENSNGSCDYLGASAYQPAFADPSSGFTQPNQLTTNNWAWCIIEDLETCIRAIREYYLFKDHGGTLDINAPDFDEVNSVRELPIGTINQIKRRIFAAIRALDPYEPYMKNARNGQAEPASNGTVSKGVGRRDSFRATYEMSWNNTEFAGTPPEPRFRIFERQPEAMNNAFFWAKREDGFKGSSKNEDSGAEPKAELLAFMAKTGHIFRIIDQYYSGLPVGRKPDFRYTTSGEQNGLFGNDPYFIDGGSPEEQLMHEYQKTGWDAFGQDEPKSSKKKRNAGVDINMPASNYSTTAGDPTTM